MKKDARILIEHIVECIELIEKYTEGVTMDDFFGSVETKAKYPDVPWREIAGMRDIFIHEYFGIDLNLTWEAVKKDIPELKTKMLGIREELK